MFQKQEAIEKMNEWGGKKIPFLFIIDYEMKAIQLFPFDSIFPGDILFVLPGKSNCKPNFQDPQKFVFVKNPIPLNIYEKAFNGALYNINAGNSFLLNLTFPTSINIDLSLKEIFYFSKAKYKLLVKNQFVVFSPETFITIRDGFIYSNPMKGTINAALLNAEEKIRNDTKEIAEHYTIVDLIRNDLSMVASDIKVKRFRYIDRLVTNQGDILQVSSEIEGKLPPHFQNNLGNIVFSLLPAGSITGAPKLKTMDIIREIEICERGYYTGIFGFFDGESLDSAVMIRFIENRNNEFWFHSGGGITSQSKLMDEYTELIDKVYVPIY